MDTLEKLLKLDKTGTAGVAGGADADLETVFGFVTLAVQTALMLAGMVAFVMVLYSSVLYVTSFGDETKAETAKKTLLWAIIGLIAVSLASFIINMIDKLIK